MPVFVLKIKCEIENIEEITSLPGNLWKFNVSSGDGGHRRDGITVTTDDEIELEGSKGTANFVVRWDKASSQSYIKIVNMKNVNGSYKADQTGKWVSILAMDCRGIEPVEVTQNY